MKIVTARVQSTRIGIQRPHQMAIGTSLQQENVILQLETEDGTVGFGEAPHMVGHSQLGETPETVRVVLRDQLIPAILGASPFDQERLTQTMERLLPGNSRAKGAVVMAAYDLAGKLLRTPVYNLLGGAVRDRVPLSWSLPIVEIATAVEEGLRMLEHGFRILKVKVGRPDPAEDIRMIRELRRAVGPGIRLRADANQAFDVKTALRVIRGVEAEQLDFFEQPVHRDDLEGMAEVRRHSPIPIMADESANSPADLALIARLKAADCVSIYIIGPGGLVNSKKMAALAEAHRMRAYLGGALESIIGASAALHLAASSPAIDLGCEMYGRYLLKDDLGFQPLPVEDGCLRVPETPGLGCAIDEKKLSRYRQGEVEHFWLKDR